MRQCDYAADWILQEVESVSVLQIVVSVVFVIVSVVLSAIILMQEGKSSGLGAVAGMADTYWGKNKGRSFEGNLQKFTRFLAICWMLLAIALNVMNR